MRRYVFISFAMAGVIACSSDDSSVPTLADAGADAPGSDSGNDGSVQGDGGGADAPGPGASNDGSLRGEGGSADDGAPDAGDANITSSLGSTGEIDIYNDLVSAQFFEDDTILRSDDAPGCVVHVRSATKPSSVAGTVTVGGAIVGSDGGTPSVIELAPPDAGDIAIGAFYQYFGPVFPATDDLLLQVDVSATLTFPSMGVQSLRLPPANPLAVTQPALPDSGNLTIPSTQALTIAWTVPSGLAPDAEPGLQVGLQFIGIVGGDDTKLASLFCSFSLSAGTGQVPADLLSAIVSEVGANPSGFLEIFVGSQIEFTSMGASYSVAVALDPSTSNAPSFNGPAELQ